MSTSLSLSLSDTASHLSCSQCLKKSSSFFLHRLSCDHRIHQTCIKDNEFYKQKGGTINCPIQCSLCKKITYLRNDGVNYTKSCLRTLTYIVTIFHNLFGRIYGNKKRESVIDETKFISLNKAEYCQAIKENRLGKKMQGSNFSLLVSKDGVSLGLVDLSYFENRT